MGWDAILSELTNYTAQLCNKRDEIENSILTNGVGESVDFKSDRRATPLPQLFCQASQDVALPTWRDRKGEGC